MKKLRNQLEKQQKNYYQLDKGFVDNNGGSTAHVSYGIPGEKKFETKEEALKELFNREIIDIDYIELNYFEDHEYEDTIITFYGPEAKKIIANDLYNGNVLSLIIKEARIKKGLSQRAVAEKIGVPYQHFQNWEYGKWTPNNENLKKLSEVLEIDLSSITLDDII